MSQLGEGVLMAPSREANHPMMHKTRHEELAAHGAKIATVKKPALCLRAYTRFSLSLFIFYYFQKFYF